ncbi:type II secretion system protein GspC [Aliidiomarina celeris]|uniref:type II secretion system protein GspC n=1 Tax=Aliidiomarina celeris TaxID=2249428 RepID=UPI0013001F73|nr:type II secretion system protein GspC [Aliidiomarina celeris]
MLQLSSIKSKWFANNAGTAYFRWASATASLIMVAFAAWLAGGLFWSLFTPAPNVAAVSVQATPQPSAGSAVNVSTIQQLHLFGQQGVAPVRNTQTTDAPETTLNIRLVGVTASSNPNLSAAIIQQGSNQQTYIPGDTVAGSRAVVQEILSDRVLLNHNNRTEILWIEGRDGSEVSLNVMSQAPTETEAEQNLTDEPTSEITEADLSSAQLEILELISITPQPGGNGLIGYRLAPRGDDTLFRELGLRAGDLAVSINGYDLTDMAEAMQLMNELQGLSQAQIRVLRDGEYVDIDVYIPTE